jgi:hypothetical protein
VLQTLQLHCLLTEQQLLQLLQRHLGKQS